MTPRFSLTLLSILLAIILPWWASGFILLLFVFLFPWYYEAALAAFTYDLLHGSAVFWLTIAVLIIVPLAEELKKKLYVFS